ncbi:MAG: outer membrane protein assembly factor BamA [Deltaproteobacteria bacterium]|uniref:outer membrane protein assembly factor BamA n=1 Tax=Desulfobacula sp. TaxID=2593537 RepID=UPI0019C51A25|nr:outer membrane protein assembly factor BamA [Candidatus Desulfobacula maris]MBL6993708.1 outer membrane protein assembly factor BamA [Desulfobacula sp.]
MTKFISKNIFILILLIFSFLINNALAESNINIAVFPFSIYASQSNDQVKDKIPLMISEKLQEEGAKTIFVKDNIDRQSWDYSQFREQGIRLGVDHLITGSVFIEGKGISIDTKLINTYEKDTFTTFFSEADNIENLYSAISQLTKEMIGVIFHKKIITDIAIVGNKRVEADAILRLISIQTGDILKPDNISKDLEKIYAMGYFDDIIVRKESQDKGVKVIFEIKEKSTVRKIKFKKNKIYKDEELLEVIDTRTGSILNIHKLNSDINRMRLMYTEKNYHNCLVTYETTPLDHSQSDIVFTIEEGEKIRVEKITFEGNKHFTAKKIKKAMETSEKGFFSFITSSGNLNETEIKNDTIRIESLYKNNGFIDAKVSDPIIDIGKELISIHFKIDEGAQYKIKKVDFTGDLILSKKEILDSIQSKETSLYNRESIRNDILSISDIYSNKGFANVKVIPMVDRNDTDHMMTITYSIDKGQPVYFNRINISGNLKTRDKIIRREIKINEQDLYSKENIQKSFKNLNRLDYFAGIDIEPQKTSDENKMDLNVKVLEKQTGNLSIGGGYSSEDGVFFMGSVEERNLFGRGQNLKFSATIAGASNLYNISFFESYIFDTAVSGGFDLYKEDEEYYDDDYDYYDKAALGLNLKLGYKLFDYTIIGVQYNLENFDISNVQTNITNMTPGSFLTSSIKPYIQYDSRDDFFFPTEGFKHKFSIEYAGEFLGGEIDYTKYIIDTGVYFPLFWKFTGTLHAEAGYLEDQSRNDIDIDYVKFYLGGMNSIRGFDKFDISGRRDGDTKERGGEKYVQFNAEMTFPFAEKYKIAGIFFYDRGDVYRKSENIDFGNQYSSIGTGIRWNSPVGPLRLEYGWVIEGKDVKETWDGQFEFSIGASF